MKNAYFNDLQIHSNTQNIGIWLKPNIEGLEMPEIRLPSFERPNVDGAFVPNQLYGGRAISLEGKVHVGDLTLYRQKRRALENSLKINRPAGSLEPLIFKFKTMDDLELQVECYTKKFKFPDKHITASDFTVDLYAPDIRILSQTLKSAVLNVFEGGGMAVPMPVPMDFAVSGSVEQPLVNGGNFSTFPFITIRGTIEDPNVVNLTTGESFSFDYTLTDPAQYIQVDVKNRTALYFADSATAGVNIRQYFTGDWFELAPGSNTVRLIVADTTDNGSVTVEWRDAYIGL